MINEANKEILDIEEQINQKRNIIAKYEAELRPIEKALKTINKLKSKPSPTDEEIFLLAKEPDLSLKEQELNDKITEVTIRAKALNASKITIEKDKANLHKDLKAAKIDIGKAETAVKNKFDEIKVLKQNYDKNQVEKLKNIKENKAIAQKYEEAFNVANRNRLQVQQLPFETEDEYINRIKSLEALPFNDVLFKDKAALEESRKLQKNLKQVLRNDVKISEIIRNFPKPEDVYEINKYFKVIKERLINMFGTNNENVSISEYVNEIIKTIELIHNPPTEGFELEEITSAPTAAPAAPAAPAVAAPAPAAPAALRTLDHDDGTPSDFEFKVVDNSLYIKNTANGKHLYIKIGRKDKRNLIFFSTTTNDRGNFNFFSFKGSTPNTWANVMVHSMQLLTDENEDIYKQVFGDTTKSDTIFEFLKTTYKLQEIDGIKKVAHYTGGANRALTFGWGIKHDEIPKHVKFGKNILLLNKLFFKNILSIKDSNMHAIERFPNVHVSDDLAQIIFNMCIKKQPTKEILDTLTTNEKELLDMLLYLSGLHKNINNKKDDHIIKLKDRLKLVESEIRAGNNNPILKNELKDIIHKLYLFGAVSMHNSKNYLKQL